MSGSWAASSSDWIRNTYWCDDSEVDNWLVIRGTSAVARELAKLVSKDVRIICDKRDEGYTTAASRYLICQGMLYNKPIAEQSKAEILDSYWANCGGIIQKCTELLRVNSRARICVMGSESGYSGSYDETYATAKLALHQWVETTKLKYPEQQLVAVAPSIISDAGMTERRKDQDNLIKRKGNHPKQRFVTSLEVAKLIHFLLYVDEGYITNTVVRMHGGGHVE